MDVVVVGKVKMLSLAMENPPSTKTRATPWVLQKPKLRLALISHLALPITRLELTYNFDI